MKTDDLLPNRFYEFSVITAVLSALGVFALVSKADAGLVAAVLGPIVTFASSQSIMSHWSDHKVKTAVVAARGDTPDCQPEPGDTTPAVGSAR